MSEKGLERETEGISVGEREPVVADSSPKGGHLRSSWKKLWKGRKRKALALLLVVAIAGGVVIWRGRGQTASAATTYQEAAVERRSITNSLSSSGTLEPADSYTVNTLVSGEILSDTFEKGDQVEEGQLLYTIDSSNAASSQTQAQNSYSQAQTSYEQAVKAKYPQADLSGTVSEVYVNEGDSVSAGTQLLKIVADENIYIDFYFTYADSGDFYIGQTATVFIDGFAGTLTGTVAAVSSSSAAVSTGVPLTTVRVRLANPGLVTSDYTASAVIGSYSSYGQASIKVGASSVITAEASGKVAGFNWLVGDTISSGDRICTITGDSVDNQIESARISVSNASTSLENARDNLEDYSVTAPISGTVVTRNAKAGDNIEGGSGSTLCVIYDLSYLEMTMSIDELDISSVEVGQEVRITADAVEGKTYTGVVTEVSVAGTTSGGITTYPVTVRIDETDGLLPGMNVDAEIVISSANDVLAIPSAAVSRGDMVLVTANSPSAVNALDQEAPEGYVYMPVETGVSDNSYIEVLSGLQGGGHSGLSPGGWLRQLRRYDVRHAERGHVLHTDGRHAQRDALRRRNAQRRAGRLLMGTLIEFREVCKYYQMGDTTVKAADHISFQIRKGEFVAIVGQSGSGKSTSMNIIGCLDVPTSGTYLLDGRDVGQMDKDQLAAIRNKMLGFIFQQYNLLPKLTLQENVEVPLMYAGIPKPERHERSRIALEMVGLGDKLRNKPSQLSGGQQQRASIARALAGDPAVILADEPTGALDSHTGREVLTMLQQLHAAGNTVVLITHDNSIAVQAQRIIRLEDGHVIYDGDAGAPEAVVTPNLAGRGMAG